MESREGAHHNNVIRGVLPMTPFIRQDHVVDDEFRVAWVHGVCGVPEDLPGLVVAPVCEDEVEVVDPSTFDYISKRYFKELVVNASYLPDAE